MSIVVIILLCVFNLVMWLVAMIRFRSLFSTDDILQKARDELNNMLMDINRNAERNISLIEDRIRLLKEVSAEADRHVAVLEGQLEVVKQSEEFKNRLESLIPSSSEVSSTEDGRKEVQAPGKSRVQSAKKKTPAVAKTAAPVESAQPVQSPEKKISRVRSPLDTYQQEQMHGLDKASPSNLSPNLLGKDIIDLDVEQNPPARPVKKIPARLSPEIINSKNPVKPKIPLKKQVEELHAQGMTVEEIAAQLEKSTTEINLILEFS